ncbi:glycyl-radical enzyme activating protein [Oscillibacter sp.]|uniref:glycyl-radical enzyme activating protein n=1 Tax=Oscillibacter sp. TaxID=1945593 RepID=UPI00260DA081|nr:glycyl-radical enzyme activating protein [Oscillibacter sp.]MDD3347851.1 glycyl-radical enzyme activating protein [Oscillibacter sp.]
MRTPCKEQTNVFNIQKYSVHDGPGIRTIVFLQGCPLRCPWCANPEGQPFTSVLSHNQNLCRRCGRCVAACPKQAICLEEDGIRVDRSACDLCGACVTACRMDCYKVFGEKKSVEEVLKDVAKDENFYFRSGGGLTVSGGEPLAHPQYLLQLLRGAKEELGISTAIETTCCAGEETLRAVADYVDHFLCDIKLVDSGRSREVLGVPSEQILKNIRILADEYPQKSLLLRLPVIPGYNDDPENIAAIAAFIRSLRREIPLELLAYHEFGKAKYTNLDMTYEPEIRRVAAPAEERMAELEKQFETLGVKVVHT